MNTTAYLIYCSDNKDLADDITNDLKRVGIEFIHDTFDSSHQYHKDQYTFGNPQIFLLVTDNFLKSEACMNNVMDLVQNNKTNGRIQTIVADGKQRIFGTKAFETVPTKFERLGDVVKYIDYWSIPYQEIRTEMRHASDERKAELEPRLEIVKAISTTIVGDFMRYLRSTNTITYKRLQSDQFRQIFERFGAKGNQFASDYKNLPAYVRPEVIDSEATTLESEALSQTDLDRNYEVDNLDIPGLELLPKTEEIEAAKEELETTKEATVETTSELKAEGENILSDNAEIVTKETISLEEPVTEKLDIPAEKVEEVEEIISEKVEETSEELTTTINDSIDTKSENLTSLENNSLETIRAEDEIIEKATNSIEHVEEIPDDILEDLANEIVEENEENTIEEEVLNELFDENNVEVKTDTELADLIDELADDILAENEIEEVETVKEENNVLEVVEETEEISTTLEDIVKENTKILEGQKNNEFVTSESVSDSEQIEESMPIDALIDEIAEDLVAEMNEETPLELEISDETIDETIGEKADANDDEFSDSEEVIEQSTVDIAEELAESGDLKGASGLYRQLIENAPNDVELKYAFAMLLVENGGDPLLAKEHLLKAAKLDREDEDVLFALGNLYEDSKDYDVAKKYYEQVILLDLEHEEAYYRLGNLLANHYENQEFVASSYLQRAISLDNEYAIAHLEYAKLLKNYFGKNKKASKHFKKALKYDRNLAEAHIELANLNIKSDKEGKALSHYQSAIALDNRYATDENDDKYGLTALKEKEKLAAAIIADKNKKSEGKNKTVLITGATSGIGRATAEIFAKAGYRLIITGRRNERLAALKSILEDDFKTKVWTLNFDVRNQKATEKAINDLKGDWRNIDILINNAGLAKGFSPINEGNLEHWETMIDTNLKGLLYVTRAVSPLMVERQTGYIINIGSIAGKETYLNGNVYCATKAAVDALTKGMRLDLHQHNIRISSVHPGHVETEFALVRFDGDEKKSEIYGDFQPLKAADVADTIYYLASRPAHVNIEDVVMWSTQQASATMIDRSGREKFEKRD